MPRAPPPRVASARVTVDDTHATRQPTAVDAIADEYFDAATGPLPHRSDLPRHPRATTRTSTTCRPAGFDAHEDLARRHARSDCRRRRARRRRRRGDDRRDARAPRAPARDRRVRVGPRHSQQPRLPRPGLSRCLRPHADRHRRAVGDHRHPDGSGPAGARAVSRDARLRGRRGQGLLAAWGAGLHRPVCRVHQPRRLLRRPSSPGAKLSDGPLPEEVAADLRHQRGSRGRGIPIVG
jgi:hypothetical protein